MRHEARSSDRGPQTLDHSKMNAGLPAALRTIRSSVAGIAGVSLILLDGPNVSCYFVGLLATELERRLRTVVVSPTSDAAVTGQTMVMNSADPDLAFVPYLEACHSVGVREVVASTVPDYGAAALTVYTFAAATVSRAFVEQASTAVASTLAQCAVPRPSVARRPRLRQHRQFTGTATVTDRATSLLSQRHCFSLDAASAILARASRSSGREVKDVAAEILQHRSRRTTGESGGAASAGD